MKRYTSLIVAGTLALTGACGDEDPIGPAGGGTFTATVGSSAFNAGFPTFARLVDGDLTIDATQLAGAGHKFITISLSGVTHTGTYPFGPQSVTADYAVYGEMGAELGDYREWMTSSETPSGHVTITELTSSRIVGTFGFTAQPFIGDASGTKIVTNGAFSLNLLSDD